MTKKILLADDSITIRKVVGIIFATEDYQVEMTDNGDDAYRMAQSEMPDLVIADVAMPGRDGFELCRAIKSSPEFAGKTSVMLLPGAFDHFDEGKAQDACADGWLTKPFESQALLDKVAQLLASKPLVMPGSVPEGADSAGDEIFVAAALAAGEEEIVGFGEDEDLAGLAAEGSATDDIWESVSFDDDLQDDPSSDREEVATFAADFPMEKEVGTEPIPDFSEDDDFATGLTGEAGQESFDSFPAEDSVLEPDSWEAVASEPSAASADDAQGFSAPAAEDPFVEQDNDFIVFETAENSFDGAVSDFEVTTVEDEIFEEESLEVLQEEVEEDLADEKPGAAAPAEEPDPQELILDLSEDDILEEVSEDSQDSAVEAADAGAFAGEPVKEEADPSNAAFEEAPAAAEIADTVFDEEDIAGEEPPAEVIISQEEEPVFEEEEFAAASEPSTDEMLDLADGDLAGEGALAAAASAAAAVAVSFGPDAGAAEDLGEVTQNYTEADVDFAEPEPAGAENIAPAAGAEPTLEEQLRAIPEAELKEVVGKVAGPIIEKMAAEMLEKVIWEVVPDLAEVMIREEIRKIKEEQE